MATYASLRTNTRIEVAMCERSFDRARSRGPPEHSMPRIAGQWRRPQCLFRSAAGSRYKRFAKRRTKTARKYKRGWTHSRTSSLTIRVRFRRINSVTRHDIMTLRTVKQCLVENTVYLQYSYGLKWNWSDNNDDNSNNNNIMRPLHECPSILVLWACVIIIHYCIMFHVLWWRAAWQVLL